MAEVSSAYVDLGKFWTYDPKSKSKESQFYDNAWIIGDKPIEGTKSLPAAYFYVKGEKDNVGFTPTSIDYDARSGLLSVQGRQEGVDRILQRAYMMNAPAPRFMRVRASERSRRPADLVVKNIIVDMEDSMPNIKAYLGIETEEKEVEDLSQDEDFFNMKGLDYDAEEFSAEDDWWRTNPNFWEYVAINYGHLFDEEGHYVPQRPEQELEIIAQEWIPLYVASKKMPMSAETFEAEGGEQYDYYTIERDYDEGYMNARVPTLKTNRLFDPLYYTQYQMMNDMSDRISTAFHPNAEVREQSGYGTREKQRDAIFNGLKSWNEQMIEDLNGVKRSIDMELGDRKFEAETFDYVEPYQKRRGITDQDLLKAQYPIQFLEQEMGSPQNVSDNLYPRLGIALSVLDGDTLSQLSDMFEYEVSPTTKEKFLNTLAFAYKHRNHHMKVYRVPPSYSPEGYYGAEEFGAEEDFEYHVYVVDDASFGDMYIVDDARDFGTKEEAIKAAHEVSKDKRGKGKTVYVVAEDREDDYEEVFYEINEVGDVMMAEEFGAEDNNPMDYAEQIDSGTLRLNQVDEGTDWVQQVVEELLGMGWKVAPAPFGFKKAATIRYLVKDGKSVSFLTTYFMGTYTQIRLGRQGKEFTGFDAEEDFEVVSVNVGYSIPPERREDGKWMSFGDVVFELSDGKISRISTFGSGDEKSEARENLVERAKSYLMEEEGF